MRGDGIGKPTDIDMQIQKDKWDGCRSFWVTLKVNIGLSQSTKPTNRSNAVIYWWNTHRALFQYIMENQLLFAPKKQWQHIGPLLSSPPSHWLFYPLRCIEGAQSGGGRSTERRLPPLLAACDVTWAAWSPWEKTLMLTGNNQGNTGRVQRNANIFRVLKKTIPHTLPNPLSRPPWLPPSLSHIHTTYALLATVHTHTHASHNRVTKKQQPAPWQNSPQVHLHKTLSLTKWLHLTSWVGGRTSLVAASYLQILQSFSRQATVSRPPL